jgi:hypothetical protein
MKHAKEWEEDVGGGQLEGVRISSYHAMINLCVITQQILGAEVIPYVVSRSQIMNQPPETIRKHVVGYSHWLFRYRSILTLG